MDMRRFGTDCKVVKVLDYASANADRNTYVVDTLGYDGLAFLVSFATIATDGAPTLTVRYSDVADDTSTLNSATNISASSTVTADDDDDEVYIFDCIPQARYYDMFVNKDASNDSAESAIAILYNPKEKAVTHGTGSGVGEGTEPATLVDVGTST